MFKITIESTFAKGCLIVARLVVLTATGGGAAAATTRTRLLDLTEKKVSNPVLQHKHKITVTIEYF
jgi:hypothetical protein